MIVRLMPEQIADNWEAIKFCACQTNNISSSIAEASTNNLFQLLLLEKYQAWAGIEIDENGHRQLHGILLTALVKDDLSGKNDLLLYGIYAFRVLPDEMLIDGLRAVREFARSEGCGKIFGFSNNKRLLDFMAANGFVSDIVRFSEEV